VLSPDRTWCDRVIAAAGFTCGGWGVLPAMGGHAVGSPKGGRWGWRGSGSGEAGDGLVGTEQMFGGGPAVEDTDDISTGASDDAGGGVPDGPAEPFG
jgi:hypothetical protein